MLDLVAKFEKVKVKQSSLLPPEDIEYCKIEQQRLDETLANLNEWYTFFDEKNKTETNPAFEITKKYGRGEELDVRQCHKYSRMPDDANPYDKYKYTVKFSLVKIQELRFNAKTIFAKRILSYFKNKYHVEELPDIPNNDEKTADLYITSTAVIDYIRSKLGHLDFKLVALDKAIKKFQEKVSGYYKPELKGRQLFFHSYLHYSSWYSAPSFDYDFLNKCWGPMNSAIAIFETDELQHEDWSLGSAIRSEDIDFEKEYPLINSTRIEGVRFYKNRKLLLKFKDAQGAKDFINCFQLTLKSD